MTLEIRKTYVRRQDFPVVETAPVILWLVQPGEMQVFHACLWNRLSAAISSSATGYHVHSQVISAAALTALCTVPATSETLQKYTNIRNYATFHAPVHTLHWNLSSNIRKHLLNKCNNALLGSNMYCIFSNVNHEIILTVNDTINTAVKIESTTGKWKICLSKATETYTNTLL